MHRTEKSMAGEFLHVDADGTAIPQPAVLVSVEVE
jgi:hypothetical protein